MGYLKITPQHERALKAVARISETKFRKIAKQLSSDVKPSIRASELFGSVKKMSEDDDFSVSLCKQLISLSIFKHVTKRSSEEVIDALIEGMSHANFDEAEVAWFRALKNEFICLLDCKCVNLPAMALHLSTDFRQIFLSANVITDIRPVIDGERTSISGAMVVQSLRIKYIDGGYQGEEQEVNLTLDLDDIKKLIDELNESQKNAEHVKERFGENTGAEVFIVGEEPYGHNWS